MSNPAPETAAKEEPGVSEMEEGYQRALHMARKEHELLRERLDEAYQLQVRFDKDRATMMDLLSAISKSPGQTEQPKESGRGKGFLGPLRKFHPLKRDHPHPTEWISEIFEYVNSVFDLDEAKNTFIQGLLDREVKNEIRIRVNLTKTSLGELKEELIMVFDDVRTPTDLRMDFCHRTQLDSESVDDFAVALVNRMVVLQSKMVVSTQGEAEEMLKSQFAAGLSSLELKREVKRLNVECTQLSYMQLRQRAEAWTADGVPVQTRARKVAACQEQMTRDTVGEVEEVETQAQYAFKSRVDTMEKLMAEQNKKLDEVMRHLAKIGMETDNREASKSENQKHCDFCNRDGHIEKTCRKKRGMGDSRGAWTKENYRARTCTHCGRDGHTKERCWYLHGRTPAEQWRSDGGASAPLATAPPPLNYPSPH